MTAPTIVTGHVLYDSTSGKTSHVIDAPTNQEGDLIVMFFLVDGATTISSSDFDSTLYSNITVDSTATASVFLRVATSSEPTTYTITVVDSERAVAIVFAVRGGTIVNNQATNANGTSATASVNNVTTDVADCLAIALIGTDIITTPLGTMSTHTKIGEKSFTSGGTVAAFYQTIASPTTTGADSVSLNVSEQWIGLHFAIEPTATGNEGDLSKTVDAVTISSTGSISLNAALSKSLDAVTISSTSSISLSGSLTKTLDNTTIASQAILEIVGALSKSIDAITIDSSGSLLLNGSLGINLEDVGLNGTGSIGLNAVVGISLANVEVNSVATIALNGELEVTLENISLASTGDLEGNNNGSLTKTLEDFGILANASISLNGSLSKSLQDILITSESTLAILGELSKGLEDVSLVSVGEFYASIGEVIILLDSVTVTATSTFGDSIISIISGTVKSPSNSGSVIGLSRTPIIYFDSNGEVTSFN
jgi:hypothetical protein